MIAAPSRETVPEAFAVKTREGVTLYADREQKTVLQFWECWRTNAPDRRMRYMHNVQGQTYRLRWLQRD